MGEGRRSNCAVNSSLNTVSMTGKLVLWYGADASSVLIADDHVQRFLRSGGGLQGLPQLDMRKLEETRGR